MDANKLRAVFLIFAAALFFFAVVVTDGGRRDIVQASIAIGYSLGGCVALISAAIVKKDG